MRSRDETADALAFDIGGANIKAADGLGWVHSEPFELWHRRSELPAALARIVSSRRPGRIVATMTGEIADCYASRREGVADIVAARLKRQPRKLGPDGQLSMTAVDQDRLQTDPPGPVPVVLLVVAHAQHPPGR